MESTLTEKEQVVPKLKNEAAQKKVNPPKKTEEEKCRAIKHIAYNAWK